MMKPTFINAAVLIATLCAGHAIAVTSQHLQLDRALINQDRIEYWLKKRSELANDATKAQITMAVEQYVEAYKSKLNRVRTPTTKPLNNVVIDKAQRLSGVKMRVASPLKVDANTITDVNVLAILVDFPDLTYNNNRLSPNDTAMYYADYSLEHYRDMLYSDSGFTGPGGQNLLSTRQYYKEESGNSFRFSGQVYGWYTAEQDAKFYGRNDAEDDDLNVGALVVEAVTAAVASGQVNLADFDKEDPADFDNDGNVNEADGIVDHLMLFHSSIGEEAGGGVLATDAIWSHRFVVGNTPRSITGSNVRVHGYTIQAIDSAAGVVSHEFGHDLGLLDEYDTNNSDVGAPVASWSIMATGSWLGDIFGTAPSSFSPLARDFLQKTYGGNWINQLQLDAKDLNQAGVEVDLVDGVNHLGSINQVKVTLPPQLTQFKQPFSGLFQYYSAHKDQTISTLAFAADLPNDTSLSLSMKAQWDIELNFDYAQVVVNGLPVANDFTRNGQDALVGKSNIITGKSAVDQWQTLSFDLSAYAGQHVSVNIVYVTDLLDGGFGIVVDDLKIATSSKTVFFNDAETASLTLNGFEKVANSYFLEPQHYYIQLRSHNGLDQSLAKVGYSPGVLMWLADSNYSDNHVDTHPGNGFLAVIDADQQLIGTGDSAVQIRDAAFSLYNQLDSRNDNHTDNTPLFDDSLDYSSPAQPQSGVKVFPWAMTMNVVAQATNSRTATINLSRPLNPLTALFDNTNDGLVVDFSQLSTSNVSINSYQWDFGDNSALSNLASPTHTYSEAGRYNVSLTVSDAAGNSDVLTRQIDVVENVVAKLEPTAASNKSGGSMPIIMLLGVLMLMVRRKTRQQ